MSMFAFIVSLPLLASCVLADLHYFSFGDSYADTGFDINGIQPSPGNPLGNPAYGTSWGPGNRGSFSGGPNFVDFLTTEFNSTLVYNYNFAWGGATISSNLQPPESPSIQTFEQQILQLFSPKYSTPDVGDNPWSSSSAVFSVSVGINDILHSYLTPSPKTTPSAFVDAYMALLGTLYDKGARNFLIMGIPPFERSPAMAQAAQPAALSQAINDYNGYLATGTAAFQQAHPDARTSVYDLHLFMGKILDAPTAYGFTDAMCIGSGLSRCVWWDASDLHTTSTFQQMLAQDLHDSGALAKLGW